MKYIKFILFLPILLFFGCLLFNTKNGMGVQSFGNVDISMLEIYNVLKINFPEYNIELTEVSESSSYMIFPRMGRVYVKPHHYIRIRSEKYNIFIQYQINEVNAIDSYATFPGIYLHYYLRGENIYERIDELKEPMENIKRCLMNNFSELLIESNFSERFQPIPIR